MGISDWRKLTEVTDSEETLFVGVVFVGAFSDRRVAPFYYPIDLHIPS